MTDSKRDAGTNRDADRANARGDKRDAGALRAAPCAHLSFVLRLLRDEMAAKTSSVMCS